MANQRNEPIVEGDGGTRGTPTRSTDPAAARGTGGPRDDRSLGSLIKELGDESSRLLREEVQLAKTEMQEKVDVYQQNAVKMAVGGVLLMGALFVLLIAVNRGLTALLEQFMSLEIAVWLAPLILAAVAGLIGWSLVKGAQKAMKREGVTPRKTVATLKEEKEWAKREAREVRDG